MLAIAIPDVAGSWAAAIVGAVVVRICTGGGRFGAGDGMVKLLPQAGQSAFCPADVAGAIASSRQCGQMTEISVMLTPGLEDYWMNAFAGS